MLNHKFVDNRNDTVEFKDIKINANGHMMFELWVNSKHISSRYIHKSNAQVYAIYKAYKQNYDMDDNKVFALSDRYVNT